MTIVQNTIRTLDLQTLVESTTITGLPSFSNFIGTSYKGKVYYTQATNNVVVVDAKTLTFSLLALNVGETSVSVAVNVVDDYVLVAGMTSSTMYTIHPTLGTILSKVPLPGGGQIEFYLAFNPFSGVLYTSTMASPATIQVRHPRTFAVIASLTTCTGCGGHLSYFAPANMIMSSDATGFQKISETCSS